MLQEVIGTPAMLEQTAEECVELAHACMKLARYLRGENKVYKTKEEIYSAMVIYGFLSYYDGTLKIPNKEIMKEFYQIKRVVHSYSAAIYIIPEDKELAQMVTNFKNELKKAGIEEGSEEAFKYAATKDLPYKRCIFSVFADSTSDNYRLDAIAAYKAAHAE